MKVNKALGFVTVLAFSATLMCASAYAAEYSAAAVSADAGQTVTVPVMVTPDAGETEQVNGYVMTLTYDPTQAKPVLEGTDLTGGDCYATVGSSFADGILVSDVVSTSANEETLVVAWASAQPVSVTEATDLALVDFAVDADASANIPVTVAVTQLSNDGTIAEDGTFTVASGSIDLAEAETGLLGDVNNDGVVNGTDVTLTTQLVNRVYTAESLNALYEGATTRANVNKDVDSNNEHIVNGTDVTLITQYVNKVITSFE